MALVAPKTGPAFALSFITIPITRPPSSTADNLSKLHQEDSMSARSLRLDAYARMIPTQAGPAGNPGRAAPKTAASKLADTQAVDIAQRRLRPIAVNLSTTLTSRREAAP